jgi:hypothetical protein
MAGTDPKQFDSDGDGISDGLEIANGNPLDPCDFRSCDSDGSFMDWFDEGFCSDGLEYDGDGDGLSIYHEALYGTNTLEADSDWDGDSDADEIDMNTDPTDSNSCSYCEEI